MEAEILKTWYENGSSSPDTYFVSRHSSGRTAEPLHGVCDYELYPLRKSDVDMLLYNMVWDFIMDRKASWTYPYLLFPADVGDDSMVSASILKYPYLIADYDEEPVCAGEGGVIDDSEEAYIKTCYTAEWNLSGGQPEVTYRKKKNFYENERPLMWDNTPGLKKAISDVLAVIETQHADVGDWKARLQLSLNMLETKANELHILHNAGLYDLDALWTMLLNGGHAGVQLFHVSTTMTCQLHRYAMRMISLVNWMEGHDR